MKYEYMIFKPNSTEEVGFVIPSNEPIPHMQVGYNLFLDYRSDPAKTLDLVIERIEVSLIVAENQQPQKMEVHIYTKQWNKHVLR